MKKIIAFSLWGEDPKYCIGALRNAELAAIHYPDWKCRFYFGALVEPVDAVGGLLGRTAFKLSRMPNVEIVGLDEPADWHGMFWRFYPASEDDVDVFISRDCDSRLSAREAQSVKEWLYTTSLVHSMADHPYHFHPKQGLMGGMFGMKKYACGQMKSLILKFKDKYPNAWQCDQSFLRDCVFPLVAHKIFATSDIHPGCHSFASPRLNGSFVGEIIGPDETILHPEHRTIRDAV
jgi:hypothetical protein